jgi:hypothetical protein
MGEEEVNIDTDLYDKQNADRENLQMAQMMMVEVQPWDNPIIHLERHTVFEKQPHFTKLMEQDPTAKDRFEQHKRFHEMQLFQAMAPPGGPTPPQIQPTEAGMAAPPGEPMPVPMESPPATTVAPGGGSIT